MKQDQRQEFVIPTGRDVESNYGPNRGSPYQPICGASQGPADAKGVLEMLVLLQVSVRSPLAISFRRVKATLRWTSSLAWRIQRGFWESSSSISLGFEFRRGRSKRRPYEEERSGHARIRRGRSKRRLIYDTCVYNEGEASDHGRPFAPAKTWRWRPSRPAPEAL